MSCFLDYCKSAFANDLVDLEVSVQIEDGVLFLALQHFDQLNELVPSLVLIGYLLNIFAGFMATLFFFARKLRRDR